MKEIKYIAERNLYTYRRDGRWLGGNIAELRAGHSIHVNWYGDTYSVGGGLSDPSGIFFEEDVLNLPDSFILKPDNRKPYEDDCEFIKVPIQFEGREYEGWILTKKFGKFSPEDVQNLEASLPKYFSDKPTKRLGFFDEDMNMKFDLLQEGIEKNLTPQEVWDIMTNESLSGDQKSQRLFGRPEDYISHVQYFCMDGLSANTHYLLDNNYISEKGKELSITDLKWTLRDAASNASNHAGQAIRGSGFPHIDVATLFYTNQDEYTLQGSWNYYVAEERNALVQGYNWWNYIQFTVGEIEESGLLQHVPQKRLGFFSENLNESISRNFTTDDQIREIMENEQLSIEQKSERLFNRSPEHVRMFAMCTFQIPQEVYDYANEHGGSLYHVDTGPIRTVTYDYSVGGATLMVLGNMSEPFDLEESYEYYVLGRSEKYARTNDYTMEPLGWWKYIKACVEVFETAAGYKGKRLGFFDK